MTGAQAAAVPVVPRALPLLAALGNDATRSLERGMPGELAMNALKRDAGARRWGKRRAVTGAVGLLDRVAPPVLRRARGLPLGALYFGA